MTKFNAAVCVGFRPIDNAGGAARRATLSLVKEAMFSHFEHVSIATDGEDPWEPFNRSKAKNNAARAAREMGDYDPRQVLVFADADTYAPLHQVQLAVQAVAENATEICFAHNGQGLYLTHGITRGMGAGGIPGPFPGGIFAIRRDAFETMGGWDEKFVGWGHEDISFLYAATKIFGYRTMLSNHPSIGPFFKLDLLHPRITHEEELRAEPDSQDGQLYAANTRRRDAYVALEDGDIAAYWTLRTTDVP